MSEEMSSTRRDFIRGSAYGTLGVALGLKAAKAGTLNRRVEGRAKVVLVRHADAVNAAGDYNGEVIARMLDDAVVELFGGANPSEAWASILKPDDVLGIKTNVWRYLRTPESLEQAIKSHAMEIGIAESKISIKDRGVLDDPVFQRATALINARPVRIHHWSGIGGCIKNYIMFIRQPYTLHGDSCADLGTLMKLPAVEGKTRLHILVALTPQYWGIGPHHFDPKHSWAYKGLLVGTDPVALDSTGLRLLQAKRLEVFGEEPKGGTPAKHVALAETRHGVGIADPERIDIIRLGMTEESLI